MASIAALYSLQTSNQSIHRNTSHEWITAQQLQIVKTAIQGILSIVTSKSWSTQDLEESLWDVSLFFRGQKFSTVVLPVLNKLAEEDANEWSVAKKWDTQIPLEPKVFETMKWSTVEIKGAHGVILQPLERERELALLSVYGITLETLGEVFRILPKNSA